MASKAYRIGIQQFDTAAEKLKLHMGQRKVLRSPRRAPSASAQGLFSIVPIVEN
jgi:hypothetical protein